MRPELKHALGLVTLLASSLGFFLVVAKYCVSSQLLGILELVGPGISILGYLAPLQTVKQAVKTRNLQDLPLPMFISQLSLCVVSVAYGLRISNLPILLTNAFGAALQVLWLSCWFSVTVKTRLTGPSAIKPAVFTLLLVLAVVGLASLVAQLEPDVIGLASLLLSLVFSFSPVAQLPLIIRTRSSASVPLTMSGMMFLGNLCWGTYGYLLGITVILLPCLVGLEISLLLICVNMWCAGLFPLDLAFLGKLFSRDSQDEAAHILTPARE